MVAKDHTGLRRIFRDCTPHRAIVPESIAKRRVVKACTGLWKFCKGRLGLCKPVCDLVGRVVILQ